MSTRPASRSRVSTSSRCAIISTSSAAPAAGTAMRRPRPCPQASWRPPANAISKPIGGSRGANLRFNHANHVIPGWSKGPDPESRDSGFDASHRPGMTNKESRESATMSEPDTVLVERDGPVTIVSINRPHCRNAVDGSTARKLFDAFLAFDADAQASVAVFTGTGGYFCAGADLKAVASGDPNKKREIGGHGSIAPMGPGRLRLSKPGIAAGEGFSVAGGMELALWGGLARGRRGRHLRHLLPPLRRAVDRPRHHPAAATDRPFPGDRPDLDRTP